MAISKFKKFLLPLFFLIVVNAHAQTESIEEPYLDAPSNIDAGEDNVLNQLEQLNELSSSGKGFKFFIYSEKGRRNPFSKPAGVSVAKDDFVGDEKSDKAGGLESYEVSNFQLTTVMWDVKHPKALVRAADKETFLIEEGTKIGRSDGYVAKIREGEVVIVESSLPSDTSESKVYKTQVLKLGR